MTPFTARRMQQLREQLLRDQPLSLAEQRSIIASHEELRAQLRLAEDKARVAEAREEARVAAQREANEPCSHTVTAGSPPICTACGRTVQFVKRG